MGGTDGPPLVPGVRVRRVPHPFPHRRGGWRWAALLLGATLISSMGGEALGGAAPQPPDAADAHGRQAGTQESAAPAASLPSPRPRIGRQKNVGAAANDFGATGLLTMPSARGAPQGTVEFGLVARAPVRRAYLRLHPFDWLEVVYRYDDIIAVTPEGDVPASGQGWFWRHLPGGVGHPTRKERGFDLKIRLWEEGRIRPAFAFGLQDMFGRAAFGGEYFVVSKRIGDFDLTAGLGFGYLGTRRHFGNPFRVFSGRFRQRGSDPASGGLNFGSYFRGNDVALFGGIEWASPIPGLSLLAEYSGADPARDPFVPSAGGDERIPVNFALRYRPNPWFDVGIGLEGGRYFGARASLRFNVARLPRFFEDPPFDPFPLADGRSAGMQDVATEEERRQRAAASVPHDLLGDRRDARTERALNAFLLARSLDPSLFRIDAMEAGLLLAADAPWPPERWPELARALFDRLPASVERLSLRRLDQPLGRAQIFLRRSHARDEAAAILALPSRPGAPVRLCGRRLVLDGRRNVTGDTPASALARLGEGIGEVVFVSASSPSSPVARDGSCAETPRGGRILALDRERPRLRARAVLAALADAAPEGVSLRGEGLLAVLVQGGAPDGRETRPVAALRDDRRLLARLGVEAVAVLPAEGVREREVRRAERIMRALARSGITPRGVAFSGDRASLWIGEGLPDRPARTVGRALRLLDREAPPRAVWLEVAGTLGGGETWRVEVLRRDVRAALAGRGSPEEVGLHASWRRPRGGALAREERPRPDYRADETGRGRRLRFGIAPVLLAGTGGAQDGLIRADVDVDLLARLRLAKGLVVEGALRRYILGNLDSLAPRPDRRLPAVRSDIARYSREGHNALASLTVGWDRALGRGLYMRLTAGLFEPMFGGLGGELVYRPWLSRWTFDGELYWVKQRGFSQGLGFRDYATVTGHLGVVYDAGGGLAVTGRAGRYLAGDWGATIEVAQRFANGIELGGWLTASSRADLEFGRAGSLDKGLFVRMPLDVFWAWGGPRRRVESRLRSLVRDSGQRLQLNERLYEHLLSMDPSRILGDWPDLFY